jgi:hypothetical protein
MQDNDAVNYEEAEDQLNRMGRLLDEWCLWKRITIKII